MAVDAPDGALVSVAEDGAGTGDAVAEEQRHVSMLHDRLDALRRDRVAALAAVLAAGPDADSPAARTERDVRAADHARTIAAYDAAENGLCFGRVDLDDGEVRHIGRLSILADDSDTDEDAAAPPPLIDWRAPAARPFYLATAAAPEGVRRRRHIRSRRRRVLAVSDDLLGPGARARETGPSAGPGLGPGRGPAGGGERAEAEPLGTLEPAAVPPESLIGEAALLAALAARRGGRMADIVTTIQREQDQVIRADDRGVLVVQGGPGTGKTAVALHRAAYLLYTHRERLARRGVLVVGPNATFLRYIGQVLPSLGESGVLLATVADLLPGTTATLREDAATRELKGRLAMVEVIAAAVRGRQRVPDDVLEIEVDHHRLRLDPLTVQLTRDQARSGGRAHNAARPVFVHLIVRALARQLADLLGYDVYDGENLLDETEVDDIRLELRDNLDVAAAIDSLWPELTPHQLLADLFADPAALAAAAPALTAAERARLLRPAGAGWSAADIPLLDEAAEVLGQDDRAERARAERERRQALAYAQGVLDILSRDTADDPDDDVLLAGDLLSAEALAGRAGERDTRGAAARAAADRTWTFGHIIVDEAQELSAMAWRLLMRRCPSRSMTVVGDVAQTGEPAGTSSWARVLDPYVAGWWRLETLSVNYRTPAEIMDVAAVVLAEIDPGLPIPSSLRRVGHRPWRRAASEATLAGELTAAVAAEAAAVAGGRLAVIVPERRRAACAAAVRAAVPGAEVPAIAAGTGGIETAAELDRPVVVLTVRQAKGLEFDGVLLVDPDGIDAESARGRRDLYVALTRATSRLGVLHLGPPAGFLARIDPA